MASPLEQFEIKAIAPIEVGGLDISFTNSSAAMVATLVLGTALLVLGMSRASVVPGRIQSIAEMSYEFIAGLLSDTVGAEGKRYFPFVFTLFMFILIGNLLGLLPYSFTFTSHIIVTFAMAITVFIGVTILGLVKHKMHFFSFFVPPGVPLAMWPLLIPIEIISYLSRPISLSVRLFANMLAGHTLLKVIGGFVFGLGAITFGVGGLLPLALISVLTGLEVVIAFLQAYVFAILTCLYINDALHLH
ncbi:MAG: F0F1 ATP synthase subunit A [Alphaproteobacteria bacterium]|jgi:F-type H+-transporting ATPase subunit a